MAVVHLFCTVILVGIGQNWGDCNNNSQQLRLLWEFHSVYIGSWVPGDAAERPMAKFMRFLSNKERGLEQSESIH